MERFGEPKPIDQPSSPDDESGANKTPAPQNEAIYELPPEGWMNANQLGKEFGISRTSFIRSAQRLAEGDENMIKGYYHPNIKSEIEYFHPDLVAKIRKERSEIKEVPKGQMNIRELAQELGTSPTSVVRLAHRLAGDDADLIRKFAHPTGGPQIDYFHPDLVAKMRQEISSRERAPEGWMTIRGLAIELGGEYKIVKNVADEYAISHPGSIKEYMNANNQPFQYYSPELLEIMKSRLDEINKKRGEFRKPPDGWLPLTGIAKKLKKRFNDVGELAYRALDKNPNEGGEFLNKIGRVTQYFSPVLVAEVERLSKEIDLYENPKPPEGWMVANRLSRSNRQAKDVEDIANSFRRDHPEWFGYFKYGGGHVGEHYHPDLVAKIKEILKRQEAERTSKLQ